mmetsp:Transcript_82705/g.222108  ORF Transcript_82705/g.222108 Transcript_82705/m.222108 type:complete len:226 (+) Transcript_82705:199-876(+)
MSSAPLERSPRHDLCSMPPGGGEEASRRMGTENCRGTELTYICTVPTFPACAWGTCRIQLQAQAGGAIGPPPPTPPGRARSLRHVSALWVREPAMPGSRRAAAHQKTHKNPKPANWLRTWCPTYSLPNRARAGIRASRRSAASITEKGKPNGRWAYVMPAARIGKWCTRHQGIITAGRFNCCWSLENNDFSKRAVNTAARNMRRHRRDKNSRTIALPRQTYDNKA